MATHKDIEELFADWEEYVDRTRDALAEALRTVRGNQAKLLADQFNSVFGDDDASTGQP